MELGLSLGDVSKPFVLLKRNRKINNKGLTFCMDSEIGFNGREEEEDDDEEEGEGMKEGRVGGEETGERRVSADPLVQLDLLPLVPVHRNSEAYSAHLGALARGFDVNRLPSAVEIDDGTAISSPNSSPSSFQIDFSINRGGYKRDSEPPTNEVEAERASSRASDEEENGLIRKKLRLSKEQSAFLEESFKEHNTLNPKQKLALAKQLNLRPRQVEVWFQNRRARTKLKQTEVDCEYLKRCCETLTEENKRLQKELQELRTLKTSNPFYAQLPATTLTMCPSCERVSTNKHKFYPFSQSHAHQSAAS